MSAKPKTNEAEEAVRLARPNVRTISINITGDSPLIVNRFSEESKSDIQKAQNGAAKEKRSPRKPDEEFKRSMYSDEKGNHFLPAACFKNAAVAACTFIDDLFKTEARGAFFVLGDMVKLDCSDPEMRADRVVLKKTTTTIAYRAMYRDWKCKLLVKYDANFLSAEQVVNLFARAGFSVGVGQWRPEKNGAFGLFSVS